MTEAVVTSGRDAVMHGAARGAGRPLRVMMTVDAVGGVWRYAMGLGAALAKQDVQVQLVGLGPSPSAEQQREARAVGALTWLDEPLDWMCNGPAPLAGVGRALSALADEWEADVLHLNLPSQAADLTCDLPVVVVAHSCLATWWQTVRNEPLPEGYRWNSRLNARGFLRADCIVAPSASFGAQLRQCYGPLPGLEVVHNALSASRGMDPKEPFVFAAGRWWDDGKNGRVIDAAAAEIKWPVLMAGALRNATGGMQVVNAKSLGPLPYDDLLDHVGRAGIVVSASLYEPFGLAALEGAMAGAALVLSDIPTYRELWDGCGLFFDPRDPDSLGRSVNRLCEDAELRASLGRAAMRRACDYHPQFQAQSMLGVYARAADQRHSAIRCAS